MNSFYARFVLWLIRPALSLYRRQSQRPGQIAVRVQVDGEQSGHVVEVRHP